MLKIPINPKVPIIDMVYSLYSAKLTLFANNSLNTAYQILANDNTDTEYTNRSGISEPII